MSKINSLLLLAADATTGAASAADSLEDVSPYASLISALTTFLPS